MVREGRNPGNFVGAVTSVPLSLTGFDTPGKIHLHPWEKRAEVKSMFWEQSGIAVYPNYRFLCTAGQGGERLK